MNETMGNSIMRLRKEKGFTQEQLANELGISYQAVSKWETGNSCPDIAALPLLSELLGVRIDALFGLDEPEPEKQAETERTEKAEAKTPTPAAEQRGEEFPWPDDDSFYAVLYRGHTLIGSETADPLAAAAQQSFRFRFEGPAQNVNSVFDLEIEGNVYGSACAGGNLHCEDVGGTVEADGDVTCDSVGSAVNAGGDVTCDSVGGAVNAGGDVSCDEVNGNVSAGGDVSCDDVTGSVFAGGDVSCDRVRGEVCSEDGTDGENGFAASLGEELGSMAAWGAKLGRRIAETVEKSVGKKGSFHKSWSFGDYGVALDVKPDEEPEDEQ